MAAQTQAALPPPTLLPSAHAFGATPQRPAGPPTGPPTGQPMVQLSGGDGLPVTLALRQWLAKTDPRYENSFGDQAFERSTSSGLKLTGWRPIDLAQQVWAKLEGPLSSLVSEKRVYWEARRPRKTPGGNESGSTAPMYALRCFLIGPDRSHATPHVAVLSNVAWFRKAVGSVFTKSGLLIADGFKCCGLPDMPQLYMAPGDTLQRAGSKHLSRLGDFEIILPPNYTSTNGMGIEIMHDGAVISRATVGGVIEIGESHLGMTVRHAFQVPEDAAFVPEELSKDVDCEIDIFEEEDDEFFDLTELDELLFECDSTPSPEPKSEPQDSPTGLATGLELVPTRVDLTRINPQERSPFAGLGAKLDWALTMLRPDDQNVQFVRPWRNALPDRVVLKTSSLLKYGTADSSGVLGVPMLAIPQPVLVVATDSIQPGDCGSWAMKVIDGSFVGMLIGSCPTLGELYILRMADIIDDIAQQTGVVANIKAAPPPTHVLPNTGVSIGPPQGAGALFPQDQYFWKHEENPHSSTSSMNVLTGEEPPPPPMGLLTGEVHLPPEPVSMDLVIRRGLTAQTPSQVNRPPRFGMIEQPHTEETGQLRMAIVLDKINDQFLGEEAASEEAQHSKDELHV